MKPVHEEMEGDGIIVYTKGNIGKGPLMLDMYISHEIDEKGRLKVNVLGGQWLFRKNQWDRYKVVRA